MTAALEGLISRGWGTATCGSCEGSGRDRWASEHRSDECRFCNGSGRVWISPKGRIASYPGGPFIGSLTPDEHRALIAKESRNA